jgi:gamma-glutamyltranspeptidase
VGGTPGGRTIVNNQAHFSLLLWAYGLDVAAALAQSRLHCEEAEPAKLEQSAGQGVLAELRSLGHEVVAQEKIGGPAHGIVIGTGPTDLDGATDPRWEGKVAWA